MEPRPKEETIDSRDFSSIVHLLWTCFKAINKDEPPPKEVVPEQYCCPDCLALNLKAGNCTICGSETERQQARLNFEILFYPTNFPRAEQAQNLIKVVIAICLEGLGLQKSTMNFTLEPPPQPAPLDPKK